MQSWPGQGEGKPPAANVSALSDAASFSLPEEGAHYDVLLIIRGCTGCPYLYEEIEADRRVVITSRDDMQSAIDEIRAAASHSAG